jgi:dTDP-glucose pyrophosphorylase
MNKISLSTIKTAYFLKKELVAFCKSVGISTAGGKIEITKRIEIFLETGKKIAVKPVKFNSKFDWNVAELSLNTVITDNYRNTENVRAFFKQQIGEKFHFNTRFMNWLKTNVGKTLQDAINQYFEIKNNAEKTEVAPQFEYNAFVRNYFAENKGKTLTDAIVAWNEYKRNRNYEQI